VLTQTKGKSEVEVCWDFSLSCPNGAEVKAARTCQKVKGGGTDLDKCGAGDGAASAKVENLTLNGQTPNE
jgi:hypothetical protein